MHIRIVLLSLSVMSDSLWPHELQHARLPCPSPSLGVCSDSCPLSQCIQTSHLLASSSPPVLSVSQHQGLFQWVSSLYQLAKVLELQFQHQSFQRIFRVISFKIDWVDFLTVQGILKSLLQYRSSKASTLQGSAFFMVQLSHLYMTTGKAIALDLCRQSNVSAF